MVSPDSGENTPIITFEPTEPPLDVPRPHPDEPSPDESPAKKPKVNSDKALDLDQISLPEPAHSDVDGSQLTTDDGDDDDAAIVFSNPVGIPGIDHRVRSVALVPAIADSPLILCSASGVPLAQIVEQPSWADEVAEKEGAWFVSEGLTGVRVMWNQQRFVTEYGKRLELPAEFSTKIPKDYSFDGVLVSTDPRVDLKQTVEFDASIRWPHVSFKIFDHPSLGDRPFSERLADLQLVFAAAAAAATNKGQDRPSNTSAHEPPTTEPPTESTSADDENAQTVETQPLTSSGIESSHSISSGSLTTTAPVPDDWAHVVEHTRCADVAAVRAFVDQTTGGSVYVRHAKSRYAPDDVEEWEFVKITCGGTEEA